MLVNNPKSHNILATSSFSITGKGLCENQVSDGNGILKDLHKCQCTTQAIML